MKTIKTILTLFLGIAVGAGGYHFFSSNWSKLKQSVGPAITHSSSDPELAAMETVFAHRYARFHRAKDLNGLLAMWKYEQVWENIISSRKTNLSRSFAQEITGFSFRELVAGEKVDAGENIDDISDLSLEPLLKYTVSFAQPNPEVDVLQSITGFLGAESGQLYMVDRVKK